MKKIIGIFLAVVLCISMTACGSEPSEESTVGQESSPAVVATTPPATGLITDGSRLGALQKVSNQGNFLIKGVLVTSESGEHDYPPINELAQNGFNQVNTCTEFSLNEEIGLYLDTDFTESHLDVFAVKNDETADYSDISPEELKGICTEKGYPMLLNVVPAMENYGCLGTVCVTGEPGLYNVFFVAEGTCYMMQLSLTALKSP